MSHRDTLIWCLIEKNHKFWYFSVLEKQGYVRTLDPMEASAWLIVTCSIREGAENKIWKKLHHIKRMKKTGKVRYYDIVVM